MKKLFKWLLIIVIIIIAVILYLAFVNKSDGGKNKVDEIPSDVPDLCKIVVPGNFFDNFPEDGIYPNSLKLKVSEVDTEVDCGTGYNGYAAYVGNFCVKEDLSKILNWYKNKYEPLGYEYFSMETVHYWKKDNNKILLDFVSELENGYMKYSVDFRACYE